MTKLAIAFLICGASAFATSVTYETSAVFSGPDVGGPGLSNGGATIAFDPQPLTTVTAPTGIFLGMVVVSGGIGSFTSADKIMLTVTQTMPGPTGSSSSTSTVAGSVTSTSDGIDLTFSPASFTINGVVYSLDSDYFLVAPDTNNGDTTLQADVGAPEPFTLGLMGVSLLGLGLLVRRRANK